MMKGIVGSPCGLRVSNDHVPVPLEGADEDLNEVIHGDLLDVVLLLAPLHPHLLQPMSAAAVAAWYAHVSISPVVCSEPNGLPWVEPQHGLHLLGREGGGASVLDKGFRFLRIFS